MNNIKPAKNQTDLLKQDTYTECELKWNCLELFPLNKLESVFKNIVSDLMYKQKIGKVNTYVFLSVHWTVCIVLRPK